MKISVVTPVYNAVSILPLLYERLVVCLEQITNEFEIIFVNDGSPDCPWSAIQELAAKDERVVGVNLSRNFGQHSAITAGLNYSTGDWIVVMDCDLQDQPEEIKKFYAKAQEGYDIVFGRRVDRQDSFLKKFFSRLFYKIFGYLTETKQDPTVANFGIYSRKVVDAVLSMNDYIRCFPVMVRWVGFKSIAIDIDHAERCNGCSSYSFKKLVTLAFNVIISFSDKPLRIVVKLGSFISLVSFLYALYIVFSVFGGSDKLLGWPSIIVSMSFFSGLIIFIIGIVGLYIGKIFEGTKRRPIYIVDNTTS